MMPPDYRLLLTECGIWLRRSIPRDKIQSLGSAAVDLHTSFMISASLKKNAEIAKVRAIQFVRERYFGFPDLGVDKASLLHYVNSGS